jgi:CHAT domain-containing protein
MPALLRLRVVLIIASCFLLVRPSDATPQQTAASSPSSPVPAEPAAQINSAQAESTAPTDPAAQIDELMKQCNEQMNVTGQFQRAEEFAKQALALSEKVGDKVRAANAMVYLAAAYGYQGRLAEAFEVSKKNLVRAREMGDKKVLEQALNTAAGVAEESGRSEESLAYLYECLDVAREIGDTIMHYMALLNIGEVYVRQGDPDKAEAPLLESLRIGHEIKHSETIRNPSKKATEMALLNLGGMEAARHRHQAALNYYEQVHASRPESPLWVITALEGMAEAHEQLGEPQKAIDLFQEAMPLAEKASAGLPYAKIVSELGRSQESLGRLNDALASQNRALALVHQGGGNPDYEWQFESRIGHVDRALGRNDEALEHYQKSIGGIERLRAVTLNTEEGRAGMLEISRATYAETADLLYDLHREDEALATAERGRARAFLDVLADSRTGVTDDLAPEQRKREDAILARISVAQKNLWKENITADEKKKTEAALTSAEDDLDGFHVEVRQSNPRYASVHYPEPVSVSEIQNKLLDERTALVEYLLGEKRSLVWVVTKGKVTSSVLPARKEVEDQVNAYRKLLSGRASTLTVHQSLIEINRLGAKLYSSIFQPIEAAVVSNRALIVVPDGGLDYLPFEALVSHSRHTASGEDRPSYLAEKFAVVYGPSASALVALQVMNRETANPHKMLLAFGDPITTSSSPATPAALASQVSGPVSRTREVSVTEDYAERGFSLARLPYTRDEVLAISKLFPISQRDVYLGAEAREETVKSEKLDEYRYIHFASHGFLDETRPGRSGILFSRAPDSAENGVLRVDEIMRLKMNADLVTLSACNTGLGKLVNGEGMLGLTRAFFYAGARNVAVSLWNVNDSVTATLMASFYRNLNRGLPKAEAMRQAKLNLIRSPQSTWRHPYFWAPFVIEGEGR